MAADGYKHVHTFAGLPKTERGRSINVHVDPKGKNILYCNGNCVYIREVENPMNCDVYAQHAKNVSVAAYSPSGFYIASGDITGKVRIWDTVNAEHILKYEYQALSGCIKDISWSEDSKRLALCGEGRNSFAVLINWDTGTSCGDLSGPTKPCNSISIKPNRPYSLALASEDMSGYFFDKIPHRANEDFQLTLVDHKNFVNCVRYSPDGSKFATASNDKKCFVYKGKYEKGVTQLLGEINEPMQKIHEGGVYGIAWSPDSKFIVSCSADKTVKVWTLSETDFSSNKQKVCFTVGTTVDDMQVGCGWIGNCIFSVSLSGFINYWDMENPSAPTKVIKGHNKAITCSTLSSDRETLFTASFEGRVCYWNLGNGVAEVVEGKGHVNQLNGLSCSGETIATCAMDDTVKFIDVASKKYCDESIKMESQPQGLCANGNIVIVACLNKLAIIKDKSLVRTDAMATYSPTCVDINADGTKVAVGGEDSKVRVYDLKELELKECGAFATNGNVTAVKFSPDGHQLAACTGKKQVKVVPTNDLATEKCNWASHATKVNSICWTPDSLYLASSGIDGIVHTWNVTAGIKGAVIRGAHSASCDVTSVQWASANTLLTTGRQDCSVRVWEITH